MAGPVATVEIAFGTAPLTEPGVWTDVSAYVRSISIRRGRDHELSQSRAGECTIRLKNTDRRFDPLDTSGAYYPNVLPMRQIRVTATHDAVDYPLFYGYVEDWSQTWPGKPKSGTGDAECVLHAVDGFKLLSLYQLRQTYSAQVLVDKPVGYWKLGEPEGSIEVADRGSANNPLMPGVGALLGVTPGPLIGGSSVLDQTSGGSETGVFATDPNDLWFPDPVVEFWIKPDSFPAHQGSIVTLATTSQTSVYIYHSASSGVLNLLFEATGTELVHTTSSAILTTGSWQHIAAVKRGSAVDWYKNGALFETTTVAGAGADAPSGTVTLALGAFVVAGAFGMDGKLAHVAIYDQRGLTAGSVSVFPPSRIAAHYAATFGDVGQAPAGTQIGILLDQMGWPAGLRTIDAGANQMQSFDPEGSALAHLLTIAEDSENGLLQMSADGKLTFHSRTTMLASTGSHGVSQATFGDAGAELPYEDVTFRYDDQDLWTRVVVTRDDGAPQLATDPTALTAYGPRTLDRSAPRLTADADSQLLAAYLLGQYRSPEVRPVSVGFKLGSDNDLNAAVLGREAHHDRVTVVRRPPGGGSAISFEAHVEGITYDINGADPWDVDLALVPEPGVRFVFDELTAASGWDGGVTETNSGTGADVTLSALAFAGMTGVLDLATGTTTTGRSGLLGTANAVQLGALETLYQGALRLPVISDAGDTYTVRAGLGDSVAAESVDFVGFRYTHGTNSGRWQGVCRSNSVETARDTGVTALSLTWVKLGFTVNLAGTSVQFYMDDIAVGAAVTTNIPTGASRLLTYLPAFIIKSTGTTSRSLLVDRYAFVLSP